ncbi:MAG: hypothetical protein ABFS05_03675 [Bacteroidota bacterium]
MKTKYLFISLISLLLITSGNLFGQDQIFKRNQEVIHCKVKEIGTESIKYNLPDYSEDVVFAIERDKIFKIVFEDGKELKFMKEIENPENYADNKKNAIKIDFLSPLTGNTSFSFEHSIAPGRSIEAGLGIIGLGFDPDDRNPAGAFIRFGYKFIKSPDFYFNKLRYAHILKGAYVKPEISVGMYSKDVNEYYLEGGSHISREQTFSGTIHLVLGKQWVFSNVFLVDFFGGIGYGFDDGDGGYHYGYSTNQSEFPISGSAGLKIGLLIK